MMPATFTIPIKVESESNLREHWRAKHGRKKKQQAATLLCMRQVFRPAAPPFMVRLTRVAPKRYPRRLDPGNLEGSFKHVQDAIAAELGVDDGDASKIRFSYHQRTDGDEYAVQVEISELKGTDE